MSSKPDETSDVIRFYEFVIKTISAEYALETWLATPDKNYEFVI